MAVWPSDLLSPLLLAAGSVDREAEASISLVSTKVGADNLLRVLWACMATLNMKLAAATRESLYDMRDTVILSG
jgi:uncharacterized UPF0146 family protein